MVRFNLKTKIVLFVALLCIMNLNAQDSAYMQNPSKISDYAEIQLFHSIDKTISNQGTMSINEYFPLSMDNEINSEWGHPVFSDNFAFINTSYWETLSLDDDIAFHTFDNVQSMKGKLMIRCKKENKYVTSNKTFYNITTGDIWTKGNLGGGINGNNNDGKFQYGYFETFVQWSRGKGMHPCFWLFGGLNGEGHEIDICEPSHYGKLPNTTDSTPEKGNGSTGNQHIAHFGTNVHRFVNNKDISFSHHFGIPNQNTGLLSDVFNKYAVEWTPYEITWYFNDREIRRLSKSELFDRFGITTLHPMRLILGIGYDNRIDQDSPNESLLIAEYIRVYQKNFYKEKPKILYGDYVYALEENAEDEVYKSKPESYIECGTQINLCNTLNSIQFYASNYQSSDLLKWKIIDGNGYIIGDSISNGVKVAFHPSKRTMTLKLTATNTQGNSSSRTLVITNRMDPYFFIDKYSCTNGVSSLKVIANNSYADDPNVGSEWSLATCDVDGNIIENGIQIGWGKDSYTFYNLESNRYYRIFHGVWKNGCSDWSQASRVYHTSYLRSFDINIEKQSHISIDTISAIIIDPNAFSLNKLERYNIKLDAHHKNDPTVFHQWWLHQSDTSGILGNQIGLPQNTQHAEFQNLICDKYYVIKHGVWSQCNEWKESRRLVYVPSTTAKREAILCEIDASSSVQSPLPSVNIYPNPISERLTINSTAEIKDVYIFDLGGRLMKHCKSNNYTITIDCNDYQTGEYLFLIVSKNFTVTKKVLVL